MKDERIYFPNLNGLRFIAAFLVIIHHIEQIKSFLKIDNYLEVIPFVGIIGKLGVVLFFVLSGFLITYLLLAEEQKYKKISIKKFYIRRILRIWPLYFLIILLSLLILPNISIFTLPGFGKDVVHQYLFFKIILYAVFFPNLVFTLFGMVPYACSYLVCWNRRTVLFSLAYHFEILQKIPNCFNVSYHIFIFNYCTSNIFSLYQLYS